eukprot:CAMPEP_0185019196 /NCGR_PEP_ID=MMETSP1103-20130426/1822_1 /TAXON_ID=36769 /ORGANISM="Paraphysomonas bandaiensis, Strain Caron Lab Isolate" /LENGTH=629 /DNA_ID=CAMNT_0027549385 /DNA_START=109 /DNA_END=1998 /DNA_ORIENTATION=-
MLSGCDCNSLSGAHVFGGVVTGYILIRSCIRRIREPNIPTENDKALRASIRQKYSSKRVPEDVDTVIIGSGMGGLSCAAILARLGKKVLVLEQHNDVAGGGTHQFDLNGFRFDSGLHYTVPWSVPIFALTCGKKESDVCPFELMGDSNSTVDKIHLHNIQNSSNNFRVPSFDMQLHEAHMKRLYNEFPHDRKALDEFMRMSNRAMDFVKVFLGMRLLPKWLQRIMWNLVPRSMMDVVSQTAEEILPRLTSNKKLISLLSSMWIDTGARPDKASFMMTAAVFRGVSMEGGCYPSKGAESMAIELAQTIRAHGGTILVRASVDEILTESGHVCGVRVRRAAPNAHPTNTSRTSNVTRHEDVMVVRCRRVVSACGYSNTFNRLLPGHITKKHDIPRTLPVKQSAGFVMANIGINGSPEELDIFNTNTWHIPTDASDDAFVPMRAYFESPLGDENTGYLGIPTFITFPSVKDKEWSSSHPGRVSCQMLMMADYSWFERFAHDMKSNRDHAVQEYENIKRAWARRAEQMLFHYFPKAQGHVSMVDISTPLAIENYLFADQGAAVGIDVTPERFVDPVVRDHLDCVTKIPGLFLTGQDTVLCGVTLCQLSGVITALRMEGFCAGVKILLSAILAG